MGVNGSIEIDGRISGELSAEQIIEGELQHTGSVQGELSIPAERIVSGDYEKLRNRPQINEVELIGNKTFEELGDTPLSNLEIKAIFDNVFK